MVMQRVGHRYRDAASETTLDVWFAQDNPASLSATAEPLQRSCLARRSGLITSDFVEVQIDLQAPPQSVEDAYLRLHLLSECQVRPNQLNLENLFGCLTNVAWTSAGPVLPEHVGRLRHLAAAED
ncbi:MAG: tetrahydrodipicolinate succinyltransferase, partial [Pseudomonadota bacterium]